MDGPVRGGRAVPWVLPTAAGWAVTVLGLALTATGSRLGVGPVRDLGVLLVVAVLCSVLVALLLVVAARPRVQVLGPVVVRSGRRQEWRVRLRLRIPRGSIVGARWIATGLGHDQRRGWGPVVPEDGLGRIFWWVTGYAATPRRRGEATLRMTRLGIMDPLGLARGFQRLHVRHEVVVLPQAVLPTDADPTAALGRTSFSSGSRRASTGSSGVSPAGIRDYRAGDPLRSIHWRKSASAGELLVTIRDEEAVDTALLVLDLGGQPQTPAQDLAVGLAAGYLEHWGRSGVSSELILSEATLCQEPPSFVDPVSYQLATALPRSGAPVTPISNGNVLITTRLTLQATDLPGGPGGEVIVVLPQGAGPVQLPAAVGGWRIRAVGEHQVRPASEQRPSRTVRSSQPSKRREVPYGA